MINYLNKDITTVDRGIIAHGCNCQGVMGSGVAKFLRDKHPKIFKRYNQICFDAKQNDEENSLLGQVDIVNVGEDLYVANCFTQHLYGYDKGKYAHPNAIKYSLEIVYALATWLKQDVYLPKIGAGRGGLDWETEVEPIIQNFVNHYTEINTYVCTWAE